MLCLDDVVTAVRRELRGKASDVPLNGSTRFADLGLTSLQVSEVLFALEDGCGAEFDTAQAALVQTLEDVVLLANGALSR